MSRYVSKRRLLYDQWAEALRELQALACQIGDDPREAERLGGLIDELERQLLVENQKLEAERLLPAVVDGNQRAAAKADAVAAGITRRDEVAMGRALEPVLILGTREQTDGK